jgi:hypothetical protein
LGHPSDLAAFDSVKVKSKSTLQQDDCGLIIYKIGLTRKTDPVADRNVRDFIAIDARGGERTLITEKYHVIVSKTAAKPMFQLGVGHDRRWRGLSECFTILSRQTISNL